MEKTLYATVSVKIPELCLNDEPKGIRVVVTDELADLIRRRITGSTRSSCSTAGRSGWERAQKAMTIPATSLSRIAGWSASR